MTGSLALIVGLYLLHFNQRRAAMAVGLSFALTAGVIALGKITLYSKCAAFAVFASDLRSPSGHTALSCAVYGTIALVVASAQHRAKRAVLLTLAAALICLIAVSRVAVGAHSPADVVAGLAVGTVIVFGIWQFFIKGHPVRCVWWPLAAIGFLWALVLYGVQMPGEQMIRWVVSLIRRGEPSC